MPHRELSGVPLRRGRHMSVERAAVWNAVWVAPRTPRVARWDLMPRKKSKNIRQRTRPTQKRSQVTVEAILEGAAQLMVAAGTTSVAINEILRRAGVGAGTFYQYFASRDALLVAMIEFHATGVIRRLEERLTAHRASPLREMVNAVVGGMVDELHAPLHRMLMGDLSRLGRVHEVTRQVDDVVLAVVQAIFEERAADLGPRDPAVAAFLVVRGVELLAATAAAERPQALRSGEIRKQLCDLVYGFLTVAP